MAITIETNGKQEKAFRAVADHFAGANIWVDPLTVSTDGTVYFALNFDGGAVHFFNITPEGAVAVPDYMADVLAESETFDHVDADLWIPADA